MSDMLGARSTSGHNIPTFEPLEPRLLLESSPASPFPADLQATSLDVAGVGAGVFTERLNASPAVFVENRGQWADPSVRYVHSGEGANVAMTDAGPVFQLFRREAAQSSAVTDESDSLPGRTTGRFGPADCGTQMLEFSATLVGASPVAPVGLEQSETRFNYLVGEQENWHSDVPAYEVMAYPALYDGIDLLASGRRDSLKYEFHVAPGADWRQIQIKYEGIEGLVLGEDGALRVSLGDGWDELVDDAPHVYQVIDGQQVEVSGTFALLDNFTYGFAIIDTFDPDAELVIDPDLAWATYLGGSGSDYGNRIAVDGVGNAYVTGCTTSSGWATPGAYGATHNGNTDVFVAKLSASGDSLLYCTYLGGSDGDVGSGIAVDGTGNAYVTGYTSSSGWATPGAYNTTYGGSWDVFVAKLSATGASLLYCTYLGGSSIDFGYSIALDDAGNAYVTGYTNSPGWATPGAYDTSLNGNTDVFVAKVSATGDSLLYCTYLGGSDSDYGKGIGVDGAGNAYVTGYT